MRAWTIAAAAVLLFGAPVAAQDPPVQMGQANVQQCLAMMGGAHPDLVLHLADSLGLAADQRTRLEALRERNRETAMPHMQPAMQAHA
ncbi:MAG TPA: hypothetical protein VFZ24_03745, partial [Longimicrobiales bacterium]